jgi:hypothetical protein
MATQIAGLIASLWLGLLILTGSVEMWHIYVQVAVQGFTQAFDTAARQALFPRLVPRRYISEAVTLNSTAGRVSGLVGPAIGGLAIATLGSAWPFLINAATFPVLVVALLLLRHLDPAPPLAPSSFVADMRDGLTYILRAPILRGLLQLDVVFALFQLNPVMITILALEVIRVGPEGLGGLLSARALGAMAGVAVLLTLGHPERQGRFAVVCTIVYAACLVPLALTTSFALSFVLIALTGMLDSLVSVTRHSVMQLAAPPEMRGRVMSNMAIVTRLGQLGQTQSGVVVAAVGPLAAVLVSAVAIALSAGLTGYGNRLLWDSSRSDLTE